MNKSQKWPNPKLNAENVIVDPYPMVWERQKVDPQIYTKRNKAKRHHTNIYVKKMEDKTNQNRKNRRTQSKRRDQRNTSTPLFHKNAD